MLEGMSNTAARDAKPQLRAGVYARLSETYDAAESVPTQLANGERHAQRRGWVVAARFKDDGYSAYKEITRQWNRFEKACVRHGVLLSPYTGEDLDLSTPEGAWDGDAAL